VNKHLALFIALPYALLRSLPAVEAQQGQQVYRVGLLSLGSPPSRHGMWQNFLDAMREPGYIEGRNLIVSLGLADGRPERLPQLVAGLVRAKMDVIVTTSTLET
jgi:putative ABC transport system substrate-binding protein